MELPGLLWACFRPFLLGGLRPPPFLTWFSSFLVRSSANFAKKIQELAEDKAENPRTCRGQSREENPYERLQENSNLQAFFFQTPFLIATLPTPKTLGGGTPPQGGFNKNHDFKNPLKSVFVGYFRGVPRAETSKKYIGASILMKEFKKSIFLISVFRYI